MRFRTLILLLLLASVISILSLKLPETQGHKPHAVTAVEQIPSPKEILGFTPGDDRKLASWSQVLEYFEALAKASNRVKFELLGKSTMDLPFVMATISAPENLAQLDEYKRIQELLADPRKLGPNADRKAAELIKRSKTIVLITCGIHSTEVGSYLSSMLIAHRLASSNEPEIQEMLKNCIILLVPSLNPDGVDIVKKWYDKTLGTPYEGTDPPELYHKYTGHDNNRDWYAFTQVETRITVDRVHNVWHPQVVHDIHQQGSYGSRLFLPPYMQPIEPNVPRQIVEGYTELGGYMAREMRAAGFKGITTDSTYDAWSPSRAYSHYHAGIRILSETASCKIATPITVRFDQLRPELGYDPKQEAPNFSPVWRGGEWHLRDITNYMTTAAFVLLKHASQNREQLLERFYEIGREAVRPRKSGELFGFVYDVRQTNSELIRNIFERAGVNVTPIDRGYLLRMDQPYGGFAKAVLENQHYPDLRDQKGTPVQPYDVTAHTLSLLLNLKATAIYAPFKIKPAKWAISSSSYPVCTKFTERNAIYRSHVPSVDEGWTRLTIETERDRRCLSYSSLQDEETRAGNLRAKYDSIVIPDQPARLIFNGYQAGTMPPEYTGGLGTEGVKALRDFVEQGGTLVCLNRASDFAIEQFKLPLRNVVAGLPRTDFYVPGSILRIELDTSNPIAAGMPKESIAWAEDSPVFEVVEKKGDGKEDRSSRFAFIADKISPLPVTYPLSTMKLSSLMSAFSALAGRFSAFPGTESAVPASAVQVIARYPADKNPLLSGWLLGGGRIKGKAALVEVTMGKGHIILFGFRPQYRGQSLASYPLFFNAIRRN